jgi:predicted anti-sigma-YlaC factor YlaD
MRHLALAVTACAALAGLGGCSIQHYAIDSVGDLLASGGSVYETDDDPELIAQALPFGLKLVESLLAERPEHRGLLLSAARGYTLYSYAFVSLPADEARFDDLDRARELRERARNLALRAHGYAVRALELDHPGIAEELRRDADTAALDPASRERDVPALYWSAASLALAISSSRNEAALLARLPEAEALLRRALAIDEAWNAGALHELAISLSSAGVAPPDTATLETHYDRALALSRGGSASVHVAFAEAVTVPAQDRARFSALLERALAIDVDAYPERRLLNVLARQRAEMLLGRRDDLFLE